MHSTGSSKPEIMRRFLIARDCTKKLDKNIWRSRITLDIKLWLYNEYNISVLLYGAETWTVMLATQKKLDTFDQWCLRRILKIPYITNCHVGHAEARCFVYEEI